MPDIVVWVDGGCRRNGQADAETYFSGLIRGRKDTRFCIDPATYNTNNQAEYGALIYALDLFLAAAPLTSSGRHHIEIRTDCQLILTHLDSIKSRKEYRLKALCEEVEIYIDLLRGVGVDVDIIKVPRDEIVAHLGH